ncbi:hypothetical protein CXP40_23445 [Pseudomonas sp. YY-1]|uniref:hypothetical protein n=1 Tax=Pseudomonas sp. YY-1 TaxID=2058659 RepID=UPI000CA6666B|nr:hypothetical protein [Pseudomonas sp. YY-1]PKQ38949.1 hypothetical protein CXP40_23445 [Pseudomonas sp. YY-1]
MKKHLIASIFFNSVLSLSAFASELDAKHTLLEQRWYSFSEVIEKRKKYDMVDISRGFIEYYFEGDEYTPRYPEEQLSPRQKFYSNHGYVKKYAAADYEAALEKACIDVVSGSLGSFKGSYENSKRADRQHYKRMVVGIRSLTYKGPEHNFKSPLSWSPAALPEDKRSLLCEIYEVKSELSDVQYIVYAASMATAMFDEILTAPLPGKDVE